MVTLRQILAVAVPAVLVGSVASGAVYTVMQGEIAKEKADKEQAQKDTEQAQKNAKFWEDKYNNDPKTVVLEDIVAHLGDHVPVEKTTVAFKALEKYASPQNWDVANLLLEKSNISVDINDVGGSMVDTHLVYTNGTSVNLTFELTPDQTRNAVAAANGYVNGKTGHVFIEPQINVNSLSVERHVGAGEQATLANMVGFDGKNVTNVVAKLNKEDGSLSYSFMVDGKEKAVDKENWTLALNWLEDKDTNAKGYTSLVDALGMGKQVWQTAFNFGNLAGNVEGFGEGWNASVNDTEDYLLGQIANVTHENKSVVLDHIAGKVGATLADVDKEDLWAYAFIKVKDQGFAEGDNSGKSVADFIYKSFNGTMINNSIKEQFKEKDTNLYNASQWNRSDLLKLTYDLAFDVGNNSGISWTVDQLEQILANHGITKDLDNKDAAAAGNALYDSVFEKAYREGENQTLTHNQMIRMDARHFANLTTADDLTKDVNFWVNAAQSAPVNWGYNSWIVKANDQKSFDALMNWSNNASVNASLKGMIMKAYASGSDIYFMDTEGAGAAGGYIANVQNGKAIGGWIVLQEQINKGLEYKPK